MSNTIDINIKTTADTSGAKETEKAIKGVSSEVEDLNDANQKAAEEQRNAEQAADVRRIKTLALAKAIQEVSALTEKASAAAHEYAKELGAVDPAGGREVEKIAEGLDLVSASANGAAAGMAALGPPGAVIGAVIAPALAKLKDEATGAFESFRKLKEIEAIGESLPAVFERIKKEMMVKAQAQSWQELIDRMNEAEKQAASLSRIGKAQRDLDESLAKQNLDLAKAGGGDVAGAEKELTRIQGVNFSADQSETFRAANEAWNRASMEYMDQLILVQNSAGETNLEQLKLANQLRKTREALEDAERKYVETREIGPIEAQKFYSTQKTQGKIADLQKTKGDETATVDGINGLVESIGSGGSKELQAAAKALADMTSDNVLTVDELRKSATLLAQFGNQITNLGVAQNAALRDATSKIDDLTREIQNIKLALRATPSR